MRSQSSVLNNYHSTGVYSRLVSTHLVSRGPLIVKKGMYKKCFVDHTCFGARRTSTNWTENCWRRTTRNGVSFSKTLPMTRYTVWTCFVFHKRRKKLLNIIWTELSETATPLQKVLLGKFKSLSQERSFPPAASSEKDVCAFWQFVTAHQARSTTLSVRMKRWSTQFSTSLKRWYFNCFLPTLTLPFAWVLNKFIHW